MTHLSPPTLYAPPPAVTFDQMLEKVRYEGVYSTPGQARDVTRRVLQALGRQLPDDERRELASALPQEAAELLTSQDTDTVTMPLTGWGFVKDLAERTGASPATTRWDTGAVLGVVARLAGDDLTARIVCRLPEGYALLFGRAQLLRAV
ncbi:DUF2267 domain-containing protein [Streptomyces sp. NPDC001914]|uniref:DUF2267 domain-containing protein n=1 Tax=Streptomyces sp. NPDC001914 TaxID=3364623 RepID=UPI0036932638